MVTRPSDQDEDEQANASLAGPVVARGDVVDEMNKRNNLNVAPASLLPDAVLRVNLGYNTTALRVALADKRIFDSRRRLLMRHVDEPVSQHEFFALIMDYVKDDVSELVSRWWSRPGSAASERALKAAVEVLPRVTRSEDEEGGPSG